MLGAVAIMLLVGLIDDVRDVSAPAKVAGQVLAAMVLYALGVTMYHFKVPFAGYIVLSPSVLPLVTALWVVGIANAVNLIDGLDGLAAGVVAIAAGGALRLRAPPRGSRRAAGEQHRPARGRGHMRAVHRLPARTTSTGRASSWATPVPWCSAC